MDLNYIDIYTHVNLTETLTNTLVLNFRKRTDVLAARIKVQIWNNCLLNLLKTNIPSSLDNGDPDKTIRDVLTCTCSSC